MHKLTNKNQSEKFINWIINNKNSKLFKVGINSKKYKFLKDKTLKASMILFNSQSSQRINIKKIGVIKVPYFSFGNISSVQMWDLEDLFLFSYYSINRKLYDQAYDLGANIGLHSVILSKCKYKKIKSYEPDPFHINQLKKNFRKNKTKNVHLFQKAIFDKTKTVYFNRILGNTQSSHINNAKENPYGKIVKIKVKTIDFKKVIPKKKTLIKMDIENVEGKVLKRTTKIDWVNIDAFVEVGNYKNAKTIYQHMKKISVNIFAHKIKWKKVKSLKDMPISYKEGLIFISLKKQIPSMQ